MKELVAVSAQNLQHMELPWAEPYRVKMVQEIYMSTREQREQWIEEGGYNLFNLASDRVFIDLLTDSGTGSMSDKQWAEIMLGDESYAGSQSYSKLREVVRNTIGFPYFLPMHQGRAAENVLFSILVKENNVVPGNSHFDTTKGHIEFRKARAVNCSIDEASDIDNLSPFKGNVDLAKLEKVYKAHPKENIPFCIITVTCNSSGGQPVSMENIKAVKTLSRQYGIPLLKFTNIRSSQTIVSSTNRCSKTTTSTYHSNPQKIFYLALNKLGQPRKTHLPANKELGKLATYAKSFTFAVPDKRTDDLISRLFGANHVKYGLKQLCDSGKSLVDLVAKKMKHRAKCGGKKFKARTSHGGGVIEKTPKISDVAKCTEKSCQRKKKNHSKMASTAVGRSSTTKTKKNRKTPNGKRNGAKNKTKSYKNFFQASSPSTAMRTTTFRPYQATTTASDDDSVAASTEQNDDDDVDETTTQSVGTTLLDDVDDDVDVN